MSMTDDRPPADLDHRLCRDFVRGDKTAYHQVKEWIRSVVHVRYGICADAGDELTSLALIQIYLTARKADCRFKAPFERLVRLVEARYCLKYIHLRGIPAASSRN
jgi:hypothetical protein